jgi:ribosomal protein S12 methylthiotransferase accessory factor
MKDHRQLFYRLAAGVDVVPLGDSALLVRSDTLAARIEGASATVLREQILPLLDGRRSLAEVAGQLPNLGADDLRRHLDALVAEGILERTVHPVPHGAGGDPLFAFLNALGLSTAEVRGRLARLRVAILGLEGPGAHAAAVLATYGVGQLVLVDPFPCQPGNLGLMPLVGSQALGQPREQALKRSLEGQGVTTRVDLGAVETLTPAKTDTLTSDCQLVIGTFDKGFSAANYWLNSASLKHGVPAIYARVAAHVALVGPLVIPTQSACYVCWRIRSLACEDSYGEAMAYEEFLGRQVLPRLHERPALPALAPYVGGLVASEATKLLLSVGSGTLAGKIHEFDALRSRGDTHLLLQVPDCPACGGDLQSPEQPRLGELLRNARPPGDLVQVEPSLVSPRCGVIRALEPVPKGPREPASPYLFSTRIANHRLVEQWGPDDGVCSGKGLTLRDARASALGEAVERYSAAYPPTDDLVYSTRDGLGAPSLDPAELVLYRREQYSELPYTPYSGSTTLGWVEARSLVTGSPVLVPALAVRMGYILRSQEELICSTTSNGLATGPTLTAAVLRALYEVLERDAFLIAWMNRLPGQQVAPETHPESTVRDVHCSYARRGVELRLYRLASDHPCHVLLSLAVQQGDDGPAAAVGLGADLDLARAATKAITETAQTRTGLRSRLHEPSTRSRIQRLVADPRQVGTIDDHALRYAHRDSMGAFSFLESGPDGSREWTSSASAPVADQLQLLVEHFRAQGGDILYCNLTPPDMAKFGLHTARVIVRGFQPIHFGWNEARLGGRRLYELPSRLGITATPTGPADLNPDPHPLA